MSVDLKKSYSALNEKIVKLFDESGVRRSFTVPYLESQEMSDHVAAVGQAAQSSGGLTGNLLMTAHHSDGKGWGSSDGHTTGHPAERLRTTIIHPKDEKAKAAIDAAQKHIDNIQSLLGDDDPTVKTANGQLALVKKTDGQGMNLLDFGVFLTQIMYPPTQAVARAHSQAHPDGASPSLRQSHMAPQQGQEGGSEAQGAPQDDSQTSEGPIAVSDAQSAPQAATDQSGQAAQPAQG